MSLTYWVPILTPLRLLSISLFRLLTILPPPLEAACAICASDFFPRPELCILSSSLPSSRRYPPATLAVLIPNCSGLFFFLLILSVVVAIPYWLSVSTSTSNGSDVTSTPAVLSLVTGPLLKSSGYPSSLSSIVFN